VNYPLFHKEVRNLHLSPQNALRNITEAKAGSELNPSQPG
jgi:hypothetical protein